MFDKLKNIKLFGKKKNKKDEEQSEDIFSSSGEGDDFFSEPSFGDEEGTEDSGSDFAGDEEDTGADLSESGPFSSFSDDVTPEIPDSYEAPKKKIFGITIGKGPKKPKVKAEAKPAGSRRMLLLFLLFLVFAGYATTQYILPEYDPELSKEVNTQIEEISQEIVAQVEALIGSEPESAPEEPKKIAIKVQPKPAPAKPGGDKAVKEAPVKPAPPAKTVTTAVEKKPAEEVKAAPVQPKDTNKAPEPPKPAIQGKPVEKAPPKPVETVKVAAAPPKKPEPMKAPAPVAPQKDVKPSRTSVDMKTTKASLPVSEKGGYFVQAGAFIFKDNLNTPKKKIESLGYRPRVEMGHKYIKMNRVIVGEWRDFLEAEDTLEQLKREGFRGSLISKNEKFSVLIGSYYYRETAIKKKRGLEKKGFEVIIYKEPIKMRIHHLLIGPFNTAAEAADVSATLKNKNVKSIVIENI